MKLISLFSLLAFSMFFIGCASSSQSNSGANSGEEGSAQETSETMDAKTAYDGSTGGGLLMERYKAGQIEGYRE